MKAASLKEIKQELEGRETASLLEVCLRLAKFKKENKELITYLLFEAEHEQHFISHVKEEIGELFNALPEGNAYYVKKSLRKILRFTNRQVKYSGLPETELALRIFFCAKMKAANVPLQEGTVMFKLYQQQLLKVKASLSKLDEDLQADYQRDTDSLAIS